MKIINTYEIKDNFKDISIVVNTAHVEIKESENSDIKVVCHERKKHAHNVRVEDSTLIISKKKRKWYSYLLPSFDKANITIYIPINKIENLYIKSNTGDVNIDSINIENDLNIKINTGDIKFDNMLVKGKMHIKSNTGDINFNESDANELYIKVNTGNVGGTLLSDKAFVIRCNTGRVRIPDTFGNKKCQIISNTGNIKFEIKK